MLQSIEDQVKQDYWSEWEQICFSIKCNGRNMNCRREVGAPAPTLSGIGFLGRRPLVPVGAGVVMGWVGTLVVALVSVDGRTKGARSPGETTSTRIPTPHPNLSRPYRDAAASQKPYT